MTDSIDIEPDDIAPMPPTDTPAPQFQEDISQELAAYMQATDPDDRTTSGFAQWITQKENS
jgi:hypothetical protein